jgi:methyl-accepting chemotaxis protein
MKNLSLTKKFAMLLTMFVGITVVVLTLSIQNLGEGINFASKEKLGNAFQAPIAKLFYAVAQHRIAAQRALYGNPDAQNQLGQLMAQVDQAFSSANTSYKEYEESLQLTPAGLASRKREHVEMKNITKEWQELKAKVRDLKPNESNDLHEHIITDLRTLIAHSGDISNLILDPDLDSYYLMDISLLALPQTQDRIQNAIIELEPIVRRQNVTLDDRIKANILVSMMREADLARIEGDFSTALNEDSNFYGRSDTLDSNLTPVHSRFVASYGDFIRLVDALAAGKTVPTEKFTAVSEKALEASFDYNFVAMKELDHLLDLRIGSIQNVMNTKALFSILGLLAALTIAYFFMQYLVKNLRSIVDTLNKTSGQVSIASSQSASSSSTLSEASTEQAASLQETMASVEEISAMVNQNADSATKTHAVVEMNQKVSEAGSKGVDDMLNAIGEIKDTNEEILHQMESSNREFGEIVRIISEIGEKTTVINEIVFQTKLLSFNASVEAARAGEHGKGFAVVAEEVGNLAQMSGNAAKEITDMLSDSIKKVNSIVENTKTKVDRLIDVGRDKITMGQSTAEKCRDSLNKITENAQTMSAMIAEIAHASKEQAQGVQEINKAISQLDQVTQQNSSVAQQSSNQSEELNIEAGNLQSAVDRLTVFVDGTNTGLNAEPTMVKDLKSVFKSNKNKVVNLSDHRVKPTPQHRAPAQKLVANGEAIPSSNDPNFEEF